ncbi:hypothetical protein LFL96_08655 [Paraburkholderia sp. D15]|uniref:hypothetical protein n=1 Tax=Paraburkholderia sp. D15 TaxID=2880218 RepID=UPI00247AEB0E|nr:hypothetical protein [Paraburkholderia sp. D15]WGS51552.1 hypothetical protein LFL96_08655 [Paraburkholderia sp. D15]
MKKLIFVGACLFSLLQAAIGHAANLSGYGLPSIQEREKYDEVRSKMLKNGWSPYHAPDALECQNGDKRCVGKPEMEACSDVEQAPCAWLWKKGNKYVVVHTVYGDSADIYVNVMKYTKR